MENYVIQIKGRKLELAEYVFGYGGEKGVWSLSFIGANPALSYKLDFENEWNGEKNVVDLVNDGGVLTPSGSISLPAGSYRIQLRTVGDTVWHSEIHRVSVQTPIDAVEAFSPEAPSEMRQLEQRVTEAAEQAEANAAGHAPKIGANGNWELWDYDANPPAYRDSGYPSRGAKGSKGDSGAMGAQGPKGEKGDPAGCFYFGVCSNTGPHRVVTLNAESELRFNSPQDGDVLFVRMVYSGDEELADITISGKTGAIPVYASANTVSPYTKRPIKGKMWSPGETFVLSYYAAYGCWIAMVYNYGSTNGYYGRVTLSSSLTSTNENGMAATPKAVKLLNDKIAALTERIEALEASA